MSTYIENQFLTVCPMPIDNHKFFRLQIKSDDGRSTNWININPDQFRAVERLLIDSSEVNNA